MEVRKIVEHKRDFMDLLLLADEQEEMVERYLERGDMFALYEEELISICIVTKEDETTCELKNLATYPKWQKKGYAHKLVDYISKYYEPTFETMLVGTGENPIILQFYKNCGFKQTHRVKNFFIDHYDHPIFEEGRQLVDMIYLKKELKEA